MKTADVAGGVPPRAQKKDVFLALVEAQDRGLSVPDSRRAVGDQFGLTDTEVKAIEQEGLKREWPPL